jgi:hypothetical protein
MHRDLNVLLQHFFHYSFWTGWVAFTLSAVVCNITYGLFSSCLKYFPLCLSVYTLFSSSARMDWWMLILDRQNWLHNVSDHDCNIFLAFRLLYVAK